MATNRIGSRREAPAARRSLATTLTFDVGADVARSRTTLSWSMPSSGPTGTQVGMALAIASSSS
jgi:hypothetical protein